MKRYRNLAAVTTVAIAALSGCSTADGESEPLTVFAAASLTQPFTEIGKLYEQQNTGESVIFDFAGSSTLVARLDQGADADVFTSADIANMDKAVEAGLVEEDAPATFASNTLTIVTPPGNPKNIESFQDLTRKDLLVVMCAPQVPCGSATQRVEESSGVDVSPVSEEASVTDVLAKVTSGQADAGLVYVTDAAGAGDDVSTVPFPESASAVNTYPIAVLENTDDEQSAQDFVDLVLSPEGQAVLADAGFEKP